MNLTVNIHFQSGHQQIDSSLTESYKGVLRTSSTFRPCKRLRTRGREKLSNPLW